LHPFPFDSYKKEKWDIEHVRSVKSEMPGRVDAQKRWLAAVLEFLTGTSTRESQVKADCAHPLLRDDLLSALHNEPFNTKAFPELYDLVLQTYGEDDTDLVNNTLGNLTLLNARTNRSYKNAVFPVKRRHILELDKAGTFVPLCTTNVFLKYYSTKIGQMMSWTKDDRSDYLEAIVDTLTDFFAFGDEVES